jgi:beta-N-acetylhexosaminidase
MAALTVLTAIGCGSEGATPQGGGKHRSTETPATSSSRPSTPSPHISPGPSTASLRLAGQRVVYSYRGLTPPSLLLDAIKEGEAAGVVFFGQNIAGRAQLRDVTAELQKAAAQSPSHQPLLLMIDQEGGLIRRLSGPPLESEKQIGQSADPLLAAHDAGHSAGLNLLDVGLNVNLAPVLDVYRSPGDFTDQYGRSYGRDPTVVASLGSVFIQAQQQVGVFATGKHFPGLGAATAAQNTDRRPVSLPVPLTELRSVDEVPYVSAIGAGLRLVMMSWATYPALDAERPAGLSPPVIQSELRGRLKFTGVTVTDALGARALDSFGGTGQRAVLAAGAGMDLLLCAGKRANEGATAVEALATALDSGELDRAAFLVSVTRVEALRSTLEPGG